MSDTTSLPDQPVSPGTVRTAPISEPAWLKSAASSLLHTTAAAPHAPQQPQQPQRPHTPIAEEEEPLSFDGGESVRLSADAAKAPPPPSTCYSLLSNEQELKDVRSPLASEPTPSPTRPATSALSPVKPAPPQAAPAAPTPSPAAPAAPAAPAPARGAPGEGGDTVKVEGMRELTDQISYLIQRVSRLEKLALNGHDDARSVRSISEFPLDVLKSKTGKRYLPTSRSVFLTYFSHQKNATNRSAAK